MEDDGTVSLVIALSQPSSVPFEVTIETVDMTASSEWYSCSMFNVRIYSYTCKCVIGTVRIQCICTNYMHLYISWTLLVVNNLCNLFMAFINF